MKNRRKKYYSIDAVNNPEDWWKLLCKEEELDSNIEYSGKLVLLFAILAECQARNEKLLVFSQSLFSLNVIEKFLEAIDDNTQNPNADARLGGFEGRWTEGADYFRLDGTTEIRKRSKYCELFNDSENPRARFVKSKIKG